jgi:Uma2 family endonuclease
MRWKSTNLKQIEVFRREAQELRLVATLLKTDTLESPLPPGFSCSVAKLFDDIIPI